MSILLVQHRNVDAGSVGSAALAYTNSEGAGNTNFVIARVGSTPSSVTVTDNNGNTYVADVSETTCTDHHLYIFRASNVNSGACTVTVHQTGGTSVRFIILEYSGLDTSAPLDQTNKANGTSSPRSSGSITTTSANELLLTASAEDNSTVDTVAIGNSFTIEDHIHTSNNADVLDVADLIVSSTLTTDGNWTGGTGTYVWDSVIASYKAAGGTATNTLNPGADTLTLSDPPLFALNYLSVESATLSDSRILSVGPVVTDGLALSDLAPTIWPALVLTDPLTLSDVAAVTLAMAIGPDGLTLAEVLVAAQGQNGTDALALAEIVSRAIGPTLSDALTLSDVLATAQTKSGSDSLTLADVLALVNAGTNFLTLSDALTLSDVMVAGLLAQFTDPLTLSEALLASGLVQAVDGLTLTEALTIISQAIGATNFINGTDTLTPVDSFSAAVGLLTADQLLLTDLISHTLRPSLSDALALAEALNAAQSGQLTLTDALSVRDAAAVTLLASFSDPLILAEALIASGLMSALDGLTVSEAWNLVSGAATVISVYLNATDSLSLSDTFSAQTLIPALIAAIRRHFVVPNRSFHFAVPVRQAHFVVPQRSFHFTVSTTPYALPVTPGDSDNTIGSTENLLSYDIDFGRWLQTGEGIATCGVTCTAVLRSNPTFDMTANAAAFVINSAISGTKVVGTVDPHNALIGARYTLLFSATTSLGRTLTKPLQPLDCDR